MDNKWFVGSVMVLLLLAFAFFNQNNGLTVVKMADDEKAVVYFGDFLNMDEFNNPYTSQSYSWSEKDPNVITQCVSVNGAAYDFDPNSFPGVNTYEQSLAVLSSNPSVIGVNVNGYASSFVKWCACSDAKGQDSGGVGCDNVLSSQRDGGLKFDVSSVVPIKQSWDGETKTFCVTYEVVNSYGFGSYAAEDVCIDTEDVRVNSVFVFKKGVVGSVSVPVVSQENVSLSNESSSLIYGMSPFLVLVAGLLLVTGFFLWSKR